jgi:hypothetical protein
MTKSHAAPAMRRAYKPNLWTLLTERQFNAVARMLFRTMISFGFSAPADGERHTSGTKPPSHD